jgi:hypothetical protein
MRDRWLMIAVLSYAIWAGLALATVVGMGSGVLWTHNHPERSAELLRTAAAKLDPVPTLKVGAVCELQGQTGEFNNWDKLVDARASDWNSEDVVIPAGALGRDAPLRLHVHFQGMSVTP